MPPPCIPFAASQVLQRPALLEDPVHGVVFLTFGVVGMDETMRPYHGWLIGYSYSGRAFTQTMIFNSTQDAIQTGPPCTGASPATNQCGHGGGIWMSGRRPALDSAGIDAVTGNGGYGGPGTGNWGQSVLRLNGAGVVEDVFTPNNYKYLNDYDLDLGDAGAILFASTNTAVPNLVLAAGKQGIVYVLNRASLGGFNSTNSGAIQVFSATPQGCGTGPGQCQCYEIHSPAFWAGEPTPHRSGAGLAVSANGNSGGIVWGAAAITNSAPGQGALYAFDATSVGRQLWASTDYWFATKFTIPTIANGKVYLPTSGSPSGVSPSYSPHLRVYGLLHAGLHSPAL